MSSTTVPASNPSPPPPPPAADTSSPTLPASTTATAPNNPPDTMAPTPSADDQVRGGSARLTADAAAATDAPAPEPTSPSPSPSPSRTRRRSTSPRPKSKSKSKSKSTSRGRTSRSRSPHMIAKKSSASPHRSTGGFLSRSRRAVVAAWVKVTRLGGLLGGSSSSSSSPTSASASRSPPVVVEKEGEKAVEVTREAELAPVEEDEQQVGQEVEAGDGSKAELEPVSVLATSDKLDAPSPVADVESTEAADADKSTNLEPEPDSAPAHIPEPPTEPPTTLLDILHIDPIWHRLTLTYLPPHTVTRLRRVCRYLHDHIDHSLPVTHWLPTPTLRQRMIHSLCAAGYPHTTLLARLVPRTPNGILARASRTAWPALAAAVRGKHVATVEALLKLDPSGGAVGKLICPPPRALTSKGLQKVSVLSDAAARSDAATVRALLAGARGTSADHWIPVPGKGNVLKSALMCAIEAGNVPTAQVLRELGAGWAPKSMVARPRPERRRAQRGHNVDGEDAVLDAQMGAVCIGLAVLSGSLAMLKWVLPNVHKDAIRTRPPWAYRLALLENMTPLMLAVTSDSLELVQAMLAAGAPVVMPGDAKDVRSTPDAAALGGAKVQKALQAMPAWVFSNPVDLATTKKSRAPAFKMLVEAHRKQGLAGVVHQCSFYQSDYKAAAAAAAAPSGHKLMGAMAPPMHESYLACAVRRGNVAMVQAVLDMGAQVSVPGRPWVKPEVGSDEEHCPIANYRFAALDDCDAMGYFLLCLAVKGGHDEVAEVLQAHLDHVSGGVATIPWNMHVPEVPEVPAAAPAVAADTDAKVVPAKTDAASSAAAPADSVPPVPEEDASPEAPTTDQAATSTTADPTPSKPSSPTPSSPPPVSPLHGEPLYGKTPLHLVLERPVAQWDDAGISRMLDEGAWMHVLDDQGYAPLDIAVRGAGVNHEIVKRMVGMLCTSPDKVAAGFATLSVLIHAAVIDASRGGDTAAAEVDTLKGLLAARPVECQEEVEQDNEDGQREAGVVSRQAEEVRKRFGGVSQVAGMVDAGLLPVDVELQNFPMYLEKDPFSPIQPLMEPPAPTLGDADAKTAAGDKTDSSAEAKKSKINVEDDDDDDDDTSSLCSGCGRRHGKEKVGKTKPPATPQTDIDLSLPFYAGLATPLFRAVVARNMNIVRLLLKHGAHPNLGLEHAHLSWAAQRNHVSSTIRSPLAQAVYMGDLDLVRELLAHGAAMREGEYDLTQCSVSPKHEKNSTCRVTVLLIALYLRAVARDLEDEASLVQEEQPAGVENSSSHGPSTPSRVPMSKSPLLLAANQPPPAVLPPLPSVMRTPPVFSQASGSSAAAGVAQSSDNAFTFTPTSPVHVISFTSPPQPPSTPTPSSSASSQFLTPTSVLDGNASSLTTPSTPLAHTSISLVAPPTIAIPRLTDAVKRYNLTVAQLDAIIAELRARGAPITWNRLPCPRLCRKSEQFRLVRGDELNDTVKCAEECMRHTTESLTEKPKAGASGDKGKRGKGRSRKISSGRARVSALPPGAAVGGSKSPASLPSVGSEAADGDVPPMVAADGSALPLLTSAAAGVSAPYAFSFSWANEPSAAAASSSASSTMPAPPASLFGGSGGSTSGFSFKYTPAPVEVDGAKVPLPVSPVMGAAASAASPPLLAVLDVPLPPSPIFGAADDA